MEVRVAMDSELDELVALAVACQREPATSCAYVGDSHAAIRDEVLGIDDWAVHTVVACDGDRLLGWLLAEVDDGIGRVWWWGPFVQPGSFDAVADALLAVARDRLPAGIVQEEAVATPENVEMAEWCRRHGLERQTASTILSIDRAPEHVDGDALVRPMIDRDHADVIRLHDGLFPGTHYTGDQLIAGASGHDVVLVAVLEGAVVGYAAAELQSDGSGYLDFVGVDPDLRGARLGDALVRSACRALLERGASHVHLTVREDNEAARRLYDGLGFQVDETLLPYRRGFSLD
ncbi:MAG: GNAT family N-acetyltransferase [Actinomycetota bacterium]